MINDLNPNFKIYLRINSNDVPLEKIKVGSNTCQLFPGTRALTIAQLIRLVKKMHRRGIPLQVMTEEDSVAIYGVRISLKDTKITLT